MATAAFLAYTVVQVDPDAQRMRMKSSDNTSRQDSQNLFKVIADDLIKSFL